MSTIVKLIIATVLGFFGKEVPPDVPMQASHTIVSCTHVPKTMYCITTQDFINQSKIEHHVQKINTH